MEKPRKNTASSAPGDVARKHIENFRQENRQYENLLRLLNQAGTAADRLRQALDEVDRSTTVVTEFGRARRSAESELPRRASSDAAPGARHEANLAGLRTNNDKLLEAVQERARENQLLVCRALAMMQRIMNVLGGTKGRFKGETAASGNTRAAA